MTHWLLRNPWTARMGDENDPEESWRVVVWMIFWIMVPAVVLIGIVLAATLPFSG